MKIEKVASTDDIKVLRKLIDYSGTLYVPITHLELDHLIGRLMQMCDLVGDVEQRSALKDTIKNITRRWLDAMYENRGYANYEITDESSIIKIEE